MKPMPERITAREKYGPAMKITTKAKAVQYFERCVKHNMRYGKHTREEATDIEHSNLGYFAGYYDKATRLRVEELFGCIHPVFGAAKDGTPTPEAAFAAGKSMARRHKKGNDK